MVRLSFPNYANSFQKRQDSSSTQRNVSHSSPLFLTHFEIRTCIRASCAYLVRLHRESDASFISGWQHENKVLVRNPSCKPSNNISPVKLGLTNWKMKFDTISPFTSRQYIKTIVVPQGSAHAPESNLYGTFPPANETFLKELLYPAMTSRFSDQRRNLKDKLGSTNLFIFILVH